MTKRPLLVWILLALTVALYISLAALQNAAPSSQEPIEDLQFRMMCRYAVGLRQYAGFLAQGETVDALIKQLEQTADNPSRRLRLIPVLAEVQGREAALQRLDALASTSPEADQDRVALETIYRDSPQALDAAKRRQLLQHQGWFAQLALSYGQDSASQDRRKALRPARRTFVALLIAALAVMAAGAAGLMLLIAAFAFQRAGKLPTAYRSFGSDWPPQPVALLEIVVLFLLVVPLLELVSAAVERLTGLSTYWLLVWAALLIPLWPLRYGLPREELRQALGWVRGRGFWREAGAGLIGYVTGLPVILLGLLLSFWIIRISGAEPAHPLAVEFASAGFWRLLQIYLLGCLWAPVLEELVFRGAFFSHLRRRFSAPLSALLCGLLFASVHPQGLAALPVLAAVGFVLCMIREWRGSIIACSTAHALHNGAALTLTLLLLGQ